MPDRKPDTIARRLLRALVQEPCGCMRWIGAPTLMIRGKRQAVHRYLYERERGPIPHGHDLAPTCPHSWCVHPDHRRPVPRRYRARSSERRPPESRHDRQRLHRHLLAAYAP